MSAVNTVLGPVDTSELGFTLSHEHLATNAAGILRTFPELVDRPGVIEQAKETLREAHREGLQTIIDVTTIDLGRDVEMMREVSQATGVQIVAATGNHLGAPPLRRTASRGYSRPLRAGDRRGYRGHRD